MPCGRLNRLVFAGQVFPKGFHDSELFLERHLFDLYDVFYHFLPLAFRAICGLSGLREFIVLEGFLSIYEHFVGNVGRDPGTSY